MGGRRGLVADAALASVGLLYAGTLAVLSFEYTVEARVFALVAAAAGIGTAAVYLIGSLRALSATPRGPAPTPSESAERAATRRRLAAAVALVLASMPFLYLFGVHAYAFAMTLVFLRAFAGHSWRSSLAVATGVTLFTYVLFTVVFELRFDAVGVLLPRR